MKLIDRLVSKELIGPFLFGVTSFTSIFFAGTYLLKLTNWVMNGMPVITAIEMVMLFMPQIIVLTLPMSVLLAVLLGIGRLSSDSEVTALYAGGVSLYRIAAPVIILGLLVSIMSICLNEFVAPWANAKNRELQTIAIKQLQKDNENKTFVVKDSGTNSQVLVNGGIDRKLNELKNVTVIRFDTKNQPVMILYAERAQWEGIADPKKRFRWKLKNGWTQPLNSNNSSVFAFRESRTWDITLEKTPYDIELYQEIKDSDQLSYRQLTKMSKFYASHPNVVTPNYERTVATNRWNKIAFPLASLIFAMMATPLAIKRQRSSSSVGLGMSVLIIFIYWMIWNYTSNLAIQGNLPPITGAFCADFLGAIAAIVLLRRASN